MLEATMTDFSTALHSCYNCVKFGSKFWFLKNFGNRENEILGIRINQIGQILTEGARNLSTGTISPCVHYSLSEEKY